MIAGYNDNEERDLVDIFEASFKSKKNTCVVCGKKVKRGLLDENGLCPKCQEEE